MCNEGFPPLIDDLVLPTLNQFGYVHIKPLKFGRKFVKFASTASRPLMDVGAAYGATTLAALKKGARLIANDLDDRHLEVLRKKTPLLYKKNLECRIGRIESEIVLEQGSLDGVLASGVLHFLEPDLFLIALNKIYDWLSKGGRLFFETSSVYLPLFKNFLPDYSLRRKKQDLFPGYIKDISCYVEEVSKNIPSSLILFSLEDLVKVFSQTNFYIEKIQYFSPNKKKHQEFSENLPPFIGLIARKDY